MGVAAVASPSPSSPLPAVRFVSHSTQARQAAVWDSKPATQSDFSDVTIVGGGVVGLALASSLCSHPSFRSSGASVTLVEGSSLDRAREWAATRSSEVEGSIGDWENRVIYLTEENRRWLDEIGVTPYLVSSRLGPVHSMLVSDGVSGATLSFDAPTPASQRMGTMVEISNLQQALLRHIESLSGASVQILDSSKVVAIECDGEEAATSLDRHVDTWPVLRHSSGSKPLKTRLLVGADGHNSPVRSFAGIKVTGWEYGRMGVVATMRTARPGTEERTAYQRFLPTGTVAWLPVSAESPECPPRSLTPLAAHQLSRSAASLVWTLPPQMAKAVNAMHKAAEGEAAAGETSPLAHLITAAFRLPWPSLEVVLKQMVKAFEADSNDYSWVVPLIEEQLINNAESMPLAEHAPVPVASIDKRSVAAFPLKLSHAECYLGSSLLKATFEEAGAGALQPSTVVERIITAVSGTVPPTRPVRGRTALIGDAAHTIHPLAGQGLNLGLADARSLGTAIVRATEVGGDLGSHISLSSYPKDRYLANQAMLSAVDHLHWLFAIPPPGDPRNGLIGNMWSQSVVWARSSGFEILNELGGVKRALMGFAGSEKRG